jgi:hypothetical protein
MKLIDLFEDKGNINLELARLKSHLAGSSEIFIFAFLDKMYKSGINGDNCPEATKLIDKNIDQLTDYVSERGTMVVTYTNVALLILFGIKWPWVLHWFNARKTQTIKLLLERIKANDFGRISPILAALKKIHVNWPELAIIEKSTNHELTTNPRWADENQ